MCISTELERESNSMHTSENLIYYLHDAYAHEQYAEVVFPELGWRVYATTFGTVQYFIYILDAPTLLSFMPSIGSMTLCEVDFARADAIGQRARTHGLSWRALKAKCSKAIPVHFNSRDCDERSFL